MRLKIIFNERLNAHMWMSLHGNVFACTVCRLLIGFSDILGVGGVGGSQFLELIVGDDVANIMLTCFVAFQKAVLVDQFLELVRTNSNSALTRNNRKTLVLHWLATQRTIIYNRWTCITCIKGHYTNRLHSRIRPCRRTARRRGTEC